MGTTPTLAIPYPENDAQVREMWNHLKQLALKVEELMLAGAGVRTGMIAMWGQTAAPAGYLLCQGGTFQSTQYPALAAYLGDTFGTHVGTTYYLPDFRARSPVGVGGAVVPAAGSENYSIGQKWGDSRLQQHNHGINDPGHGHSFPGGSHTFLWGLGGYPGQVSVSGANAYAGGPAGNELVTSQGYWTGTVNNTTGISTQNAGSGGMANVHPVLGINFIIKT